MDSNKLAFHVVKVKWKRDRFQFKPFGLVLIRLVVVRERLEGDGVDVGDWN